MTQITVEVDAKGNVSVAAGGVSGSGCQALTKAIESAIGKTASDTRTTEFFQSASRPLSNQAKASQ